MPLITAPLFALAGAITRFELRDTETRIQIVAFWLLAVVVQLFIPAAARPRGNGWAFLWNGGAATVAILLTKFALEGTPRALRHLLAGF